MSVSRKGRESTNEMAHSPPAIARGLIATESGVYFKSFYLLQESTTWYNKNSYNWEFKLYEGDNDLTKCILKLPARYREMILLRYHHGYTVREIAKVLGLSLPTAIKLDQRAKSRLKKMCEEEGIL